MQGGSPWRGQANNNNNNKYITTDHDNSKLLTSKATPKVINHKAEAQYAAGHCTAKNPVKNTGLNHKYNLQTK